MHAPLPAYYNRVNVDLLSRIPVNASSVLEIGCGAGALGRAYKRINPDCYYAGAELMPEPARYASASLDHVQVLDVDTEALEVPFGLAFDCIIYGDVLEHLRDPWAVLRKHAELLSEDGVVLACVPNVQHWSVLDNLLRGNWPQAEEGIFDRTHLRWFTRQGVIDLVKSAGLHPVDIAPRVFRRTEAEAFVVKLKPALEAMGIDPEGFVNGAAPLQYVVRATRRRAAPLAIEALMLEPVGGVNDVRITMPLAAMATCPGVRVHAQVRKLALREHAAGTPKVIVWQRPILTYRGDVATLRRLIQRGYLIVVDFDDHPMRWPGIEANRYLTYAGVHAVQTSTDPLASVFREFNPEVEVFPNTVAELPELCNFAQGGRLSVFFGALNREEDWAPLMPALNEVLRGNPEKLGFEVVHDRAFFDALQTSNKRFTGTCPYSAFRELMGRCEIAFLPLADTLFNRMKSDLKFVEAGAHGLAALASPTVYAGALRDAESGRLFSDGAQMRGILEDWIARPEEAGALGANAREWVRRNRLVKHQVAARETWLRSLWDRREDLTASLYERVPELRP